MDVGMYDVSFLAFENNYLQGIPTKRIVQYFFDETPHIIMKTSAQLNMFIVFLILMMLSMLNKLFLNGSLFPNNSNINFIYSHLGAMNAVQKSQVNCNLQRNSPNLTENNTNLNNNIQVTNAKRPRTKTTPLRPQPQPVSDDENVSINVTLARLGEREAELTLSTKARGRICYDTLSEKHKTEVQSSLLRNDTWLQMLQHLKTMRPTDETLALFQKILPKERHDYFVNELKSANSNRSG